jgi:hypothetical protein
LYPLLGDHICCTTFFQEAVSCTTLLHSLLFLPLHFCIVPHAASFATIPLPTRSHFCHHTFTSCSRRYVCYLFSKQPVLRWPLTSS